MFAACPSYPWSNKFVVINYNFLITNLLVSSLFLLKTTSFVEGLCFEGLGHQAANKQGCLQHLSSVEKS